MITVLLCCILHACTALIEPYPWINGGSFSGPAVPLSPDPLVQYQWSTGVAKQLQVYNVTPAAVTSNTESSFGNLQSLVSDPYAANVEVCWRSMFNHR